MMVSFTKSTVHFATSKQTSQSACPSHLKTGKSGNVLRLCENFLEAKHKVLFLDGDDAGTFIVPALDVRAQVPSIKDRGKRRGALHVSGLPDGVLQ